MIHQVLSTQYYPPVLLLPKIITELIRHITGQLSLSPSLYVYLIFDGSLCVFSISFDI